MMKAKLLSSASLVTLLFGLLTGPSTYAASSYGGSSRSQFGLGVATVGDYLTGSTALTGWLGFDDSNALQLFFNVPSTSPFLVGFAGFFKHTIVQQQNVGIHLGGGLGMGNIRASATRNSSFFFSFGGLAGVHFNFPGMNNLVAHLDAGPTFTVVDGNADFTIGAVSTALGLSVIYLF